MEKAIYKNPGVYEWQIKYSGDSYPIRAGFTRFFLTAWVRVNYEFFLQRQQRLAFKRKGIPRRIV